VVVPTRRTSGRSFSDGKQTRDDAAFVGYGNLVQSSLFVGQLMPPGDKQKHPAPDMTEEQRRVGVRIVRMGVNDYIKVCDDRGATFNSARLDSEVGHSSIDYTSST
jgi:hypothetical protein